MAQLPQETVRRKRDGAELETDEIADFIRGVTDDRVTEGQIAAFAMAVYFNGMTLREVVDLTVAMRDSGDVLAWPDLDCPIADKHSTGGVGDNVSLMLAPIVAACGVAVPMISGRGLGHTGGTLDKMETIPGYQVVPTNALFRKTVADVGCAIIGQTGDLAPADRRIYGVRDVTATVESVPLITASILSKKLAAGLQALVLDVKAGNGAFMSDVESATTLAESLVAVANGAGLPTSAIITDMSEPLASAAGNAVEVTNAVDFLTGHHQDPRLKEVTLSLADEMLISSAVARNRATARQMSQSVLDDGRAAERFARMVAALGGPADFVERHAAYLPKAPVTRPVTVPEDCIVQSIDTRGVGLAVVALGGGRTRPQDNVDPAVGLTDLAGHGASLSAGDTVAMVHARDADAADAATHAVLEAYDFGREPPPETGSILLRIERT
ncbi:MAG: thymidine phosphorylase [Alphaproteobacteria bacterium]|nr:thymidine phosphorylase [Alphaproteobacteria bacterium]